jgi:elongation factor 1-gamma
MVVGGSAGDLNITGLWFWKGQTLAFERSPDWKTDYEVYAWRKVDWESEELKKMVAAYWTWDESGPNFGGKKFADGKIYK